MKSDARFRLTKLYSSLLGGTPIMKKKALLSLVILVIIAALCAASGLIYHKDKYSLNTISIKDVKSVTLYPFQGAASSKKAYCYDTSNADDIKVINNMVNYLNTGKTLGTEIGEIVSQGGTYQHLVLKLNNGEEIRIWPPVNNSAGQLLVTESRSNKTYKFYSPELSRLFDDEIQRVQSI